MTEFERWVLPAQVYRDLTDQYGSPLYVYNYDALRGAFGELRDALPPALDILFSLKANPNISVCAALTGAGAGAEVSSLAELTTALAAGTAPGDIVFVGPGKSDEELTACVTAGIYAVVAESFAELSRLDAIAAAHDVRQPVLVRVNPVTAAAGARLAMGGRPRPFGIDEEQLLARPSLRRDHPHLDVIGIHAYVGTRILSPATILENTRLILALAERAAAALDIDLRAVDIGGGLGVACFPGESDPCLTELRDGLAPIISGFRERHPGTRLLLESGRYLTARAGVYLVRVRDVKESQGEWFAVTDGGTHHHLAAVGLGTIARRNFPVRMFPAPAGAERSLTSVTVTGPLCTPNDVLASRVELPAPHPGDVLAILRSGAYGPTASPGLFLSHGYPAEVLVAGSQHALVRARDTPADLLERQRLHRFSGAPAAAR